MNCLFFLHINLCKNCASTHLFFDIIKSALENGIKVDVVCKGTEEEYNDLNSNLFNRQVNFLVAEEEPIAKGNFIKRYLRELKYAKKSVSLYKNKRYDLVLLQSCNAAYFFIKRLKKLKCPIIFNTQDIFPYNLYYSHQLPYSKITFPILKKLQHKAYELADRVITISDDMKNTLVRDGIDADKVEVIYNWSYSDKAIILDNISEKDVFKGLDSKKFNVVYAGNIGKMQNVGILINVAKRLIDNKNIHFAVIGDGVEKQGLMNEALGLNNVSFFNKQSSKKVESIYSQADLNVITLVKGGVFTALPSKTATCLRTDKPCVFCLDEDSEFAKLISEEDGVYICDCCDEDKLIGIILSLVNEENHRISRTDFVEKYMSSTSNPAKYVQIINEHFKKEKLSVI